MIPMSDNNDLYCYFVTKHSSWRGKYKRIFSVGSCGVSTYDPDSFEVTNCWHYTDVISLKPCGPDFKFSITARKDKAKKCDTMVFSSEHRSEIISLTYKYKLKFPDSSTEVHRYDAHKLHWSNTRLPITLYLGPVSIDQVDTATNVLLATYFFKDIEKFINVPTIPGGFMISCLPFSRKHFFICGNKAEIREKIKKNASLFLSVDIKYDSLPLKPDEYEDLRLGKFNNDESVTSIVEFSVDKVNSPRHKDFALRLLCLSPSCLLERDPETYHIVTIRSLSSIYAFVRNPENPREFTIEYQDGSSRSYHTANRDSLLATLLDATRGYGNGDVHVKIRPTDRGKRFGPYSTSLGEEVETIHLRLLKQASGKKNLSAIIDRFNCNIPYSGLTYSVTQEGLFKENKERPIIEALLYIVVKQKDGEYEPNSLCDEELEALFQALRRLFASKAGFSSFTQLNSLRESLGSLVVKGLKKNSEAITHAAVDMICALMHPMHDDYDLKQEQLNKSSLLSNSNFLNSLLDMWTHFVSSGSGALVVSSMLDMLTFALCLPFSETTEGKNFDALLDLVAKRGRYLFKLFQHPCLTIVKGASMIMKAIIEEGDAEVSSKMQELSLTEGALPRHLIASLYTPKTDHPRIAQCRISKQLVALWLTGNEQCQLLLQRIFPLGLLSFLDSNDEVPPNAEPIVLERDNLKLAQVHANKNQQNRQIAIIEKQFRVLEKQFEDMFVHWGARLGVEKRQDKIKLAPVVLRKSRQQVKSTSNWPLFYYNFSLDHSLPNLIWNHRTREELRVALDKEVRAFESDKEVSSGNTIAWNYGEFEVQYFSLKEQLCIDGYYIKILLDKQEAPDSLTTISPTFFNNLYHRFLLPTSLEMKCMCLQALSIVYSRYWEQIGFFSDSKYIISMLEKTYDKLERDRLVYFIYKLTLCKENVKHIVCNNGISVLVDLMTLAHLHTARAVVPTQSNVIEAGETKREEEKEWHYCLSQDEKVGPISFSDLKQLIRSNTFNSKTKCWAQGMESWQAMQNIPQLKWSFVAKGTASMNESELTILILNVLIAMSEYYPSRNAQDAVIWPISRLKQYLSSHACFPHIVQLLLTFDPVIVEKVATLLCFIAKDNVMTPKLYLTGVFYFILMYTGSNVLPIAKFLQLTHTKQAFRGDEYHSSELMQRSILGQLLPEAMVYYLENHGAEKFAHIFLGEFDTPEAIWSSEMRRLLIEKIAFHLADFTPRLRTNNRAQYQYASIPIIRYPQLKNELFCNIFYLRHLCDTSKFPDWPINDPVSVMKDVLESWKSEVEKKPPVMSVDEAYTALEIPTGKHHDEPTIRKAYYRLAQRYHPDKNIQGREKFEMVNKAYEFLCSSSSWADSGLNSNNILLILQTQSILFKRHSNELQPYKYAGYNQLVKTIELEMSDDALFSKKILLLPAAIELVYYSIKCSALNAEELNRENGFQVVLSAFSRCVSVLSESTKDSDPISQICLNCTHCFSIAAGFTDCLKTFTDLPQLSTDLLRILHFKNLVRLNCAVVECITSLTHESKIQLALISSGVLWYLISFLFSYDYTLEECGIERTQEANNQEALNDLAKISVVSLANFSGLNKKTEHESYKRIGSILEKLLTPHVTGLLAQNNPHEVLKLLTCNSETPYIVWNNTTRAELLEFLETKRVNREPFILEEELDFSFSIHTSELVIESIFIRVYNEHPSFTIENPKGFAIGLLEFIKGIVLVKGVTNSMPQLIASIKALHNLIVHNSGVELQCIGHFEMFFYLLKGELVDLHYPTLSFLSVVTRNQDCVSDIAVTGVLVYLLLYIYSVKNHSILALDVLYALSTSSILTKDILQKGGLVYLLNIIVSDTNYSVETKIRCAEVLGRLCDDKMSGSRVRLFLSQYLPMAICDTMRDSPSDAVNLLQSDQENPEIIWNEKSRKHISCHVSEKCRMQFEAQRADPRMAVKNAEHQSLNQFSSNDELVVGGVYIRLYNQNPNWSLRKPLAFLTELLDFFVKVMARSADSQVELVGLALYNLLHSQPSLADHVPGLGHLPRMCTLWNNADSKVCHQVLSVMTILSSNEACVNCLLHVDSLSPVKRSMSSFIELVPLASDVLSKMFSFHKDFLVKQALEINLIPYLLEVLSSKVVNSRSKALIVQTLKSMLSSSFATTVQTKLDACPSWASYRDQNHDLFISSEPTSPSYIMGVPSTAGYLAQGSAKILPSVPPPVDTDI